MSSHGSPPGQQTDQNYHAAAHYTKGGLPRKTALSRTVSPVDTALLFARLGTASFLLFQTHDNLFSKVRMEEFADFLAVHGYPMPSVVAPLVVWLQALMALLLLIGSGVRLTGWALIGMFIVALVTVHLQQPYNLWWPSLALVQFGAIFAAAGGGVLSVDRLRALVGEASSSRGQQ